MTQMKMIDDPTQQTQERDKLNKKTKQQKTQQSAFDEMDKKQKIQLTNTADSKAWSTGSWSDAALATALRLWESESFLQSYDHNNIL